MVNQDSLILELFSRVKALEEKVTSLEKQTIEKNPEYGTGSDGQGKKITRSVARQYVIKRIKKSYPSSDVTIGNRSTPADLIIKINSTINAKFYYSRSYNEDYPSSWYTIKKNDLLDDNNLYIFTFSYNEEFHTLLLTLSELKELVKSKQPDSNDKFHFYFHKRGDQLLDVRENELDVSEYYERWEILNEL